MLVAATRRRPSSWAIPDFPSNASYWPRQVPADQWPPPHPRDAAFRRVRLYVYPLPREFTYDVYEQFGNRMRGAYGTKGFCLVRGCNLDWHTSSAQMRQYSSEVPIVMRMLQAFRVVDKAEEADAFLVPFPIGLWQVAGWVFRRSTKFNALLDALPTRLPHLTEATAARHIFLDAVDSFHLAIGAVLPMAPRAIVIHLGDDLWNRSHASPARHTHSRAIVRRGTRFNRSVVVPYRSVLPAGPVPAREHSREWLLFGAFDMRRHPRRGLLTRSLLEQAAAQPRLAGRVRVGTLDGVGSLAEASAMASRSTFCLCASGDAPSFTQRFYFSILHGCIPVRVDLYFRAPDDPGLALPFPSLIEWERIIIDLRPNMTGLPIADGPVARHHRRGRSAEDADLLDAEFRRRIDGLLLRLVDEEQRTAVARREYMRSVAHWLTFDAHGADGHLRKQDAASATLHEIARLLGIETRPSHDLPRRVEHSPPRK